MVEAGNKMKNLIDHLAEFEINGSMSKLPPEIITDFLSRVPMKSLSSCMLVSKSWYNIIKHPSFIQFHLRNSNNPPCLIFRQNWKQDYRLHLIYNENVEAFDETFVTVKLKSPGKQTKHYFEIYSCNGLIFSVPIPNSYDEPYFIYNPITGDQISVPKPPLIKLIKEDLFGFGFDPVSRVFKVIRIVTLKDRKSVPVSETIAQVYNLGTSEWGKTSTIPFNVPSRVSDKETNKESNVFVNGALHWIGSSLASTSNAAQLIVLFKLDTEEFQHLPLPPGLGDKDIRRNLLVFGECLGVVHAIHYEYIRIWVMKDYGLESSWSKEYVIRHIPMVAVPDKCQFPYQPIHMMKSGEMLLLCFNRYLGYYNCKTKLFRSTDIGSVSRILPHMGSLISPTTDVYL